MLNPQWKTTLVMNDLADTAAATVAVSGEFIEHNANGEQPCCCCKVEIYPSRKHQWQEQQRQSKRNLNLNRKNSLCGLTIHLTSTSSPYCTSPHLCQQLEVFVVYCCHQSHTRQQKILLNQFHSILVMGVERRVRVMKRQHHHHGIISATPLSMYNNRFDSIQLSPTPIILLRISEEELEPRIVPLPSAEFL